MKPTLLLLFTLVLFSCSKYEIKRGDIPSVIRKKIIGFKSNTCKGASVYRYDLNQRQVYGFFDGCNYPDGGSSVFDAEGKEVCFLGGFSGSLLCEGVRFDTAAKNRTLIWER